MITHARGGQDTLIYVALILHMVWEVIPQKEIKELLPKEGKEMLSSR